MHDLKKIKSEFLAKLKGKVNLSEINQIKSDLFDLLVKSSVKKIDIMNDYIPKSIKVKSNTKKNKPHVIS